MEVVDARVAALEQEIALLRSRHSAQLREIAAAAGLREAFAMSLVQSQTQKQHGSDREPIGGPGISPGEASGGEGSCGAPPPGAENGPSPKSNKLNRWLSRAVKKESGNSTDSPSEGVRCASQSSSSFLPPTPSEDSVSEGATTQKNKLDRWLAKSKAGDSPAATKSVSEPSSTPEGGGDGKGKLGRWLQKSKPTSCPAPAAASESWPSEAGRSSGEEEEGEELLGRIRESWSAVDRALSVLSDMQGVGREGAGRGSEANGPQGPLCPQCSLKCRGEVRRCGSMGDPTTPTGVKGSIPQQSRGMGMRVEETHRGLSVTHVVPGGIGEEAGIEVLDIIKAVNGRNVTKLKDLGGAMKSFFGVDVTFDITRGRGSKKLFLSLTAKLGDGSGSPVEACDPLPTGGGTKLLMGPDALLQTFLKARREDKGLEPSSPPAPHGSSPPAPGMLKGKQAAGANKKKYNKYGKDTQLWVPASDDGAGLELPSGDGSVKAPKQAEAGGFFMFPPGHPDYVPLPPGEAALIAGRSDVHPNERLAPHWSHIIFKAPSGAEIRAQARHATYGTIDAVAGKLVNADPITAHTSLANAAVVHGNIVYVKRGSAPFTKKAREAVAAGALACVVANSDRETFGMSFTEDGLPFESLNIPCVMISSDIASKLEVSDAWSVTLVPARPDQQGSKKPPQGRPTIPEGICSPDGMAAGVGMCHPSRTSEAAEAPPAGNKLKPLHGLEGLSISKQGANIGRPGKKPTMWKKIKLLLP